METPQENKKYLFGYQNFKWFVIEMVYTFSHKPSFFSRKRIESCLLFVNGIILLDLYYIKEYSELSTAEALAIFAANMGYAGWQNTQIRKDIKDKLTGTVTKSTDVSADTTTDAVS